jgi:hypothetical protein
MTEPDFLEVDQNIPGQNYVCLSFVSPEKVLARKEVFFAKHFAQYMLGRYLEKQTHQEEGFKSIFRDDVTPEDLAGVPFKEWYDDFLYTHEQKLTQEFSESNDFQTSVRALKIRGSYETRKEAEFRAKQLQRRDPKFHVFVGQVGYWLPWDPNPDFIQDQEYLDEKLNTLMKKYMEQRNYQDEVFTKETEQRKAKALAEADMQRGDQPAVEKPADLTERLAEMRKYADEKDEKISSGEVQMPGSSILSKKPDVSVDALGDASQYADPWMQARMNRQKELEAKANVVAEGDEKLSAEEREAERQKQLKDISKSFF